MAAKRSIDKQLLSNYIRHADVHNKVQEEQEMWRVRALELRRERVFEDWERKSRQPPLVRGQLVSDTMDGHNLERGEDSPTPPSSPKAASPPCAVASSNRNRELMRMDERDPFRWGHAGYKELYPQEFVSSGEEISGEGSGEKDKGRKSNSRKRKKRDKDKRKTKRKKLKPQLEDVKVVCSSHCGERTNKRDSDRKRLEREREISQSTSTTSSGRTSGGGERSSTEDMRKSGKKRVSRHKH